MGLFGFFKRNNRQQEEVPKDKYWSLTTSEKEIVDPSWEQIEAAVSEATPKGSLFVSLGYIHSGLEIEVIQAIGEDEMYRVEALPSESSVDYGKIFVNDGVSYEDTLKLFKNFYANRKVIGFSSWPTE